MTSVIVYFNLISADSMRWHDMTVNGWHDTEGAWTDDLCKVISANNLECHLA